MKKLLISFFLLLSAVSTYSVSPENRVKQHAKGNYQSQADSLRKEHLRPRRADTVRESPTDRMPVLKSDSNNNDPRMPKAAPKANDRMPVKELSDTSNKK
jgi:hypothetical protein